MQERHPTPFKAAKALSSISRLRSIFFRQNPFLVFGHLNK
jgi:hypothetical protein